MGLLDDGKRDKEKAKKGRKDLKAKIDSITPGVDNSGSGYGVGGGIDSFKKKVEETSKEAEKVNEPAETLDRPIFEKFPDFARVEKKPVEEKAAPAAPATVTASTSTPAPQDPQMGMMNKEANRLRTRLGAMEEGLDQLPPADRSFFANKLAEAKQVFENESANLEKRELIEKLSHAIAQLGAGLYGMKTGTDLSGLKFDKSDWEKKYDRALDKYKTELAQIETQQKTADDERRFDIQQKQTMANRLQNKITNLDSEARARKSLLETERHNRAMEDITRQRALETGDKDAIKRIQARQKQIKQLSGQLNAIYRGKGDDDVKAAQAKTAMLSTGLFTPEEVDDITSESKWYYWERLSRDPEDALNAFSTIITNKLLQEEVGNVSSAAPSAPAGSASGMVTVTNGTITKAVPKANAETLVSKHGWRVVN